MERIIRLPVERADLDESHLWTSGAEPGSDDVEIDLKRRPESGCRCESKIQTARATPVDGQAARSRGRLERSPSDGPSDPGDDGHAGERIDVTAQESANPAVTTPSGTSQMGTRFDLSNLIAVRLDDHLVEFVDEVVASGREARRAVRHRSR
ncbi:MAG TPA: hypothetical protein VG325_13320 [Solirubrobacteraceae bacterium]|jgi:hypothetical protein|nr:hypothetical protein [Solirubrobacteraceae bacterium]